MVAAISLFVFPVLITRMFFYVRNARKQRELFLHGIFSNEHGKTRRCTDAGLFCTNLTNLTNTFYVRNSRKTRKLFLHGILFSNEHGKARRARMLVFLYESHEWHECSFMYGTHGKHGSSFYTEYFLTNTEGHGGARMLVCSVRISRMTRMSLCPEYTESTETSFYTEVF